MRRKNVLLIITTILFIFILSACTTYEGGEMTLTKENLRKVSFCNNDKTICWDFLYDDLELAFVFKNSDEGNGWLGITQNFIVDEGLEVKVGGGTIKIVFSKSWEKILHK